MRSFTTLSITLIGSAFIFATACDSGSGDGGTGGSGATGGGNTGGANTGGGNTGGGNTGGGNTGGGNTGGATGGTTTGGSGGTTTGGTAGTGGATFSCTKAMGIQDLTDTGVTVGSEMYAYNDEVASCVDTLTAENNEFCISGTAGQVVNMMWDTIWGGGVGIKLAGGDPMDLTAYEGFSFTLSGTAIPSELRVGVLMDGDDNDYFTTDVAMGANALAFADLMNGDWIDEPGTLVTSMITEMKWQVPSNASAEQMFEFCVSDLALETEVAGMGGAGGATP